VLTPEAAGIVSARTHGASTTTLVDLIMSEALVLLRGRATMPRMNVIPQVRHVARGISASDLPTKTAWIRFKVLHHYTNDPFTGVQLRVLAPNGAWYDCETRSDGMAELHDIDAGTCSLGCDIAQAQLAQTLGFVRVGEPSPPPDRESPANDEETAATPTQNLVQWPYVALIDEHQVQTGDTLETIAASAGLTAAQLAAFNWGTTDPEKINEALYDFVGSTKKTPDGLNYVLDSSDKPGIIYLPQEWRKDGLATGMTHVIRVNLAAGFRLELENQDDLRIPEAAFEATLADGTIHKDKLGRSGLGLISDPPPGVVEVVYPDAEDVEAKSLAACARQALADRDLDEVFRVLKQPDWMIQQAISMYDQYFNDYTGGGFLADLDQEALEPEDRVMADALLRIADIHTEPEGD
jgi:hypothetical protein